MYWIYNNYRIYYEKTDKEYTSVNFAIQGHDPGISKSKLLPQFPRLFQVLPPGLIVGHHHVVEDHML